jgi:aminoglycoside 6'-N-acetyltransferase I
MAAAQGLLTNSATMALEIRLLGPGDDAVLQRVAEGVFDNQVDPRWSREFLNDARHHLVVALDDGWVVGMASGVHYVHPDKAPQLFINEVAVAPTHQRRGIGRAVLAKLLAHGRTLGCTEAWVGTDETNTPARRLYAGGQGVMEPEHFLMYTFRFDDGGTT